MGSSILKFATRCWFKKKVGGFDPTHPFFKKKVEKKIHPTLFLRKKLKKNSTLPILHEKIKTLSLKFI